MPGIFVVEFSSIPITTSHTIKNSEKERSHKNAFQIKFYGMGRKKNCLLTFSPFGKKKPGSFGQSFKKYIWQTN